MYPINIALKPIPNNIADNEQRQVSFNINEVATHEESGNAILKVFRAVIDYIFKNIFDKVSDDDQSDTWAWVTRTYAENSSDESEQSNSYFYKKPGRQMKIEYSARNITINARRSENEPGVSWTVTRDESNQPLVFKNDFSWMD